MAKSKYILTFEGLTDESTATIQKLKAAFIADLELSIPEVQKILQNYPCTVFESDNEEKVSQVQLLLTQAGAKCELSKSIPEEAPSEKTTSNSDTSFPDAEEFEFDSAEVTFSNENIVTEPEEVTPIEFSFEDDDEQEEITSAPEKNLPGKSPQKNPAIAEGAAEELFSFVEDFKEQNKNSAKEEKKNKTEPAKEEASLFEFEQVTEDTTQKESKASASEPSPTEGQDSSLAFEEDLSIPSQVLKEESASDTDKTLNSAVTKQADNNTIEAVPETEEPEASETAPPKEGSSTEDTSTKNTETVVPKTTYTRTNNSLIKEYVMPIIIGGLVLLAGTWGFFSFTPEQQERLEKETQLLASIEKIKEKREKEEEKKTEEQIQKTQWFSGSGENDGVNYEIKLSLLEENFSLRYLLLTFPKPQELTPEDIVLGKSPAPWLKKIQAEDIELELEEGILSGKDSARIYIEDQRTTEKIQLTGGWDKDKNSITANIRLLRNSGSSADDNNFFKISKDDSGYSFTVIQNIKAELKKQIESGS